MHVAFRMRKQYVDTSRQMDLGGHLVDAACLRNMPAMKATGLNHADLDPHDKQNYGGCLKLFDFYQHGRRSKSKARARASHQLILANDEARLSGDTVRHTFKDACCYWYPKLAPGVCSLC